MQSLTIERTGNFTVKTLGDVHCGTPTPSGYLRINYDFICKMNPDSLDERGFLFDQIGIDKFLNTIKSTPLSCERLCMDISRKLYAKIKRENPKADLSQIKLTLSPEPHAAKVIFDWSDGEADVIH